VFTYQKFLKLLTIFDVFWGRRSKIYHGIRDGGAKAAAIADVGIAKEYNGNTIFNVNNPANECMGGHYHVNAGHVNGKILEFVTTDWVDNKIEVLFVGAPVAGQIGPHQLNTSSFEVKIYRYYGTVLREVDHQLMVDTVSQNITFFKVGLVPAFKGRVVIYGAEI
jgi:hypothetical protein